MKHHGILTNQEIAKAIEIAGTELKRAGSEDNICLVYRLTLEEILLNYQEQIGEGVPFTIRHWKQNGDLKTRLTVVGKSVDPFDDNSFVLTMLRERARNTPASWQYERGQNRIEFVFTLHNTTWKNLRFSWKYTVNSRKILGASVACQLISAGLGILAPIVSARIIVDITTNEARRVLLIALTLLVVQLLRNLFLVLSNQGYNKAYSRTLSL